MMTRQFEEHTPETLLGPLNQVEQKNAPRSLFVAGDIGVLRQGARVSIVGSRRASAAGVERARTLAERLVARGAVVVSGLAAGIDTAAHEGAMAAGGRTIAVLGTPLDRTYPPENRVLQERIMAEHLAVSQFPPGAPASRKNFPMRNRTMALVSHATVIVEAGGKSGTIHQGWEALRLGRPLYLMEELLGDEALGWPQEMASYGAQGASVDALDTVFEFLPERDVAAARLTL